MASNAIHLLGGFRREEGVAYAALSPGHLVELRSDGKIQKHSAQGGVAERAFAVEDALQGNTVDDAYAADDVVSFNIVEPGAVVQAYLKAGQNVIVGDCLISGGDGTLIEDGQEDSGVTVKPRIAKALEAKNLSASGAVNTLIRVRVL
jgi:hypothetical protein